MEERSTAQPWPLIRPAGLDGFLVSFAEKLSEPANRAALAFRSAVERAGIAGVEESSSTLVSCYIRFDALRVPHRAMRQALETIVNSEDWFAAPLPEGRRFWRLPCAYGGAAGPQLAETAELAGMTPEEAVASLSAARCRVRAVGFAAGQPYLGELPEIWDIPRQSVLTPRVPEGALVVAIRQFVLFAVDAPTGWRHVGLTAAKLFQPEAERPFLLRPGDEVLFTAVAPEALDAMRRAG
ncbi:MAG: 5-oxoprolinase subunit B family protein, partial [Pikeienuella sp.]